MYLTDKFVIVFSQNLFPYVLLYGKQVFLSKEYRPEIKGAPPLKKNRNNDGKLFLYKYFLLQEMKIKINKNFTF